MATIPTNEQTAAASVVKWLQNNAGMSLQGACGAAGNMEAESHFNPSAIGDHGTSGGLCQWHDSRFTKMKNFASSKGLQWNTMEAQLGYLLSEMNSKYSSLYNTLKTTTDVVAASRQWGHDFEVFAGYDDYSTPTYAKRASYAQAIYSGVTGGGWQATDIANVGTDNTGGTSSGTSNAGTVSGEKPNTARPIMASRGLNTVYQLSSASNYSFGEPVNKDRKDKFNEMKESFSKSAPELGRNVLLTGDNNGVEVLKGQDAKMFNGTNSNSTT